MFLRFRPALLPLLLPLVLCAAASASSYEVFTGHATTYGLATPLGGSCSARLAPFGLNASLFVAMNLDQYAESASCSRCLTVTGAGGRATAFVADLCHECGHGNLDLNSALWQAVVGGDPRVAPISWRFTPCPDEQAKFCWKEGSNPQWLALQVPNSRDGVRRMEINGHEASVIGVTSFYQVAPAEAIDLDRVEVKVTSNEGISASYTLKRADFDDCPMTDGTGREDSATSGASTPSAVAGGTTVAVDTTGATAHHIAWQSYRRRRVSFY